MLGSFNTGERSIIGRKKNRARFSPFFLSFSLPLPLFIFYIAFLVHCFCERHTASTYVFLPIENVRWHRYCSIAIHAIQCIRYRTPRRSAVWLADGLARKQNEIPGWKDDSPVISICDFSEPPHWQLARKLIEDKFNFSMDSECILAGYAKRENRCIVFSFSLSRFFCFVVPFPKQRIKTSH